MKKLYTLIAACLLLLFVTPLQSIDAGVGHSRSGSSSRSSSRSLEVVALAEVVQVVVLLPEAAIVLAVVTRIWGIL